MLSRLRFLYVLFPLFICLSMRAASVNISVSCGSASQTSYSFVNNNCQSTGYVPEIPNSTSYYMGYQYGRASASFRYDNSNPVFIVDLSDPYNTSTSSGPGVYQLNGTMEANVAATVLGSARASVTYTNTIYAEGSGQGFVRGYFDPVVGRYGGSGSGYFTLYGPNGLNTYSSFGFGSNPIPITLGNEYTVVFQILANAASDNDTPSNVSVGASFRLGFFQADGRTNAAISETPEPASFLLIGFPLVGVWLWRRIQRA
jgi:hypothetical protein